MKMFERVNVNDMVSTWISRLNDIIDAFKLVSTTEDGLMSSKDKRFLDSIPQYYAPLRGELPVLQTWMRAEVIPSNVEAFYITVDNRDNLPEGVRATASNAIVVEGLNDIVVDLVAGTRDVFSEKYVCFVPNNTKTYSVRLKMYNEEHSTYTIEKDGNPLVIKIIFAAKHIFIQEL